MARTRSIALACFAAPALALVAQAAEPKPPRSAVALETSSMFDNGGQLSFASTTLRKGKKGHVLRVDVRVFFEDILDFTINGSAGVRVNGVTLTLSYVDGGSCGPASSCTVAGSGWLDLDAAEQASPGSFLRQALDIEVRGSVNAQSSAQVSVSLLAHLLRK